MIFLDRNWKIIKADKCVFSEVIIFGDSIRNQDMIDIIKPQSIRCIFDNDSQKWNTQSKGIAVLEPYMVDEDVVVITAVEDYVHIIPQLEKLHFKKIIFGMRQESYRDRYNAAIEFINNVEVDNRLKTDKRFDYVHFFPDQKFVAPVVDMLINYGSESESFDIKKHAFVINGFNAFNPGDQYHIWGKYIDLMDKYHNLIILDPLFESTRLGIEEILETVLPVLNSCKEILFHGEWMIKEVREFFAKPELRKQIRNKGVWCPWANTAKAIYGDLSKNIDEVLKYCRVYMHTPGEVYSHLCETCDLPKHTLGKEQIYYIQLVNRPEKCTKGRNVILGQSCHPYNRIPEAVKYLYKYKNHIDIYCITSYGDADEIQRVIEVGEKLFGGHFHIVDKFMEYPEYVNFLNEMDVAVFAMEDGGGLTTLNLLFWLGKKVYIKKDSPLYDMLMVKNYLTYDYYDIADSSIDDFFSNDYESHNYCIGKKEFDGHLKHWEYLYNCLEEN